MGATASVAHILQKLLFIFSMVASFDVLIQNFYKVKQGYIEKVPSFAMRLEGTLNQIRLQWPGGMKDLEVQQHLKKCFSMESGNTYVTVSYLYSTPRTPYSQLMVTTYKVESENEEIWDKVRARPTVATDLGEGMTELGQQIAKLMVDLTKAGQGNNPSRTPGSPLERGHGRGHNGNNIPNHPNPHNGRSGPIQTTAAHSLPT